MKIDYENIGRGLYEMMNDDDRAIVAFGMMPKTWLDRVIESMKLKVAKLQQEEAQKLLDEETDAEPTFEQLMNAATITTTPAEKLAAMIKPEVVNEYEREITLAVFKAARTAGKMIA